MAEATLFKILSVCKGGGYRYCRTEPPHPKRNAKGLYPLHRVLMENRIGRLLCSDEHVHHVNEDKADDSPENLAVLSVSEHSKLHSPRLEPVRTTCGHCGAPMVLKPHLYRRRSSKNLSRALYCSRTCGGHAYAVLRAIAE